jgi:hypothetical protein
VRDSEPPQSLRTDQHFAGKLLGSVALHLTFGDALERSDYILASEVAQLAISELLDQPIQPVARGGCALLAGQVLGREQRDRFADGRLRGFQCDGPALRQRRAVLRGVLRTRRSDYVPLVDRLRLAGDRARLGKRQAAVVEPTRYTLAGCAELIENADREFAPRAFEQVFDHPGSSIRRSSALAERERPIRCACSLVSVVVRLEGAEPHRELRGTAGHTLPVSCRGLLPAGAARRFV